MRISTPAKAFLLGLMMGTGMTAQGFGQGYFNELFAYPSFTATSSGQLRDTGLGIGTTTQGQEVSYFHFDPFYPLFAMLSEGEQFGEVYLTITTSDTFADISELGNLEIRWSADITAPINSSDPEDISGFNASMVTGWEMETASGSASLDGGFALIYTFSPELVQEMNTALSLGTESFWFSLSTDAEDVYIQGGNGMYYSSSPLLHFTTVPVPEPGNAALLGLALLLFAQGRRRK